MNVTNNVSTGSVQTSRILLIVCVSVQACVCISLDILPVELPLALY